MGGEWIFEFIHGKRETFNVSKYQQLLLKLRQEFEHQFAPDEVKWSTLTDINIPVTNTFAKFTYECTRFHVNKPPEHGTWTLLWDPTQAIVKNDLHARCAPIFFKNFSNKIQEKLVNEFPDHFKLFWKNGQTGYETYGPVIPVVNQGDYFSDMMRQMMIAAKWGDSDSDDGDRCIHHIPWAYCCDCSDDLLQMHGYT